ncbi:MAG TPA: hypothetical protein VKW08_28045 [Xanthobacteraceae bacterium]|nr:hypothetical protein [Xanthobacteraceae bacterium]
MLKPRLEALARFAAAAVVCAMVGAIAIKSRSIGSIAAGPIVLRPALAADGVPNFAPNSSTGWLAEDDDFIQPPSGPGPVKSDPSRPYISFYKLRDNPHPMFRLADLSNPILQPWTREALAKVNARVLAGGYVSIPKERCWPVGVPGFLLLPATPVYFLQTTKEVVMIWMQDHQVRHVYLDVPHSANLKPSWFGESVGHYEGATLVVDTIGLSSRTFVDNYQTPHTEQLHVIERYRMVNGGKTLEAKVHVEDPGAFTTAWDAIQRYRRVEQGPMIEMACAENNDDHFQQNLEPMPQADKPDF